MILLSLVGVALADTDVCPPPAVTGILPEAGAEGVPIDAQVAVQFDPFDCGEAAIELRLEALAEDGTWTTVHEAPGTGWAGEIITFDVPDLTPDTDHRITLTSESQIVTGFRTGPTPSAPLDGQPSGVLERGSVYEDRVVLEVRVTLAPDPHSPSVMALVEAADPDRVLAWAFASAPTLLVTDGFEDPESPCVRVAQWDVAGRRLADSPPVCIEAEPAASPGCSTSSGAASAALIAMALLLTRRRTA